MASKIQGLDEIHRKLERLPDRLQQHVLASGNVAVARALAKDMTIRLAGTIHPFLKPVKASQDPRPAKRRTKAYRVHLIKRYAPLAHLIEFGTAPRYQKKGRYTGVMPARPFMRPALEALGQEGIEKIWAKAAGRNVDRQLKKL